MLKPLSLTSLRYSSNREQKKLLVQYTRSIAYSRSYISPATPQF